MNCILSTARFPGYFFWLQGLEESRHNLSREREKVMKLEAKIAELNKKLGTAAELQKEVESLRRCEM
jgi:cell shape-determining protein MreC